MLILQKRHGEIFSYQILISRMRSGGGGGWVLDISLGGEVRPGPSYPDPV